MKRLRIGEPVTARDVEEMAGYDQPQSFVRLCNALAMTDQDSIGLSSALDLTERPGRDGGIDAQAEIVVTPSNIDGRLLGSGRNILQYKWRSVTAAGRKKAIDALIRTLSAEVAGLGEPRSWARYSLVTNLSLSISERRRLKASIEGAWPSSPAPRVTVWGAAEIAAFLNKQPRLRHSFFIEGSLTTWEVAEEGLRTLYSPTWPLFVGRKTEVEQIRRFITDGPGCMVVSGPPYVGKTRLVLEALAPLKTRVVWSNDAGSISEGQVLDLDQEVGTILVVDQCSDDRLVEIARWAKSRRGLSTILISSEESRIPGLPSLRLEPLSPSETDPLLVALAPGVPLPRLLWLKRVAGGLPGLAHFAARFIGSLDPEASNSVSLDELLRDLADRFLSSLDRSQKAALEVFSLLPRVAVDLEQGSPYSNLCEALGVGTTDVKACVDDLQRNGLLLERDDLLEVVPTLLAEITAARAYRDRPNLLASLLLRLDPSQGESLFERLGRIPASDEKVKVQIASVFGRGGLFSNIEILKSHLELFRRLVPADPETAVRDLSGILGSASDEDLSLFLEFESAWKLAACLRHLAERPDTFERAIEIFLRLVEVERTRGMTHAFQQSLLTCFHLLHPTTAVPMPTRLATLTAMAAPLRSAAHRELAVRTAGNALDTERGFLLEEPEGAGLPPLPAFPTRDEALGAARSIMGLIETLMTDPDPTVKQAARHEVVSRFEDLVCFTADGIQFGELVDRARTLLKTAYAAAGTDDRSHILSVIDRTAVKLEQGRSRWFGPRADRGRLRGLAEELRSFKKSLVGEGFRGRLRYNAGAYEHTYATLPAAETDQVKPHARAAKDLAEEAMKDPTLLDEMDLDWLVSKEAENNADFFIALGRLDTERRWARALLERAAAHMGPDAFGHYMMGWAATGREEAEAVDSRLDDLARTPALAGPVISASLRRPHTGRALERFITATCSRPQDTTTYLWWLSLSPWLNQLSSEEVEKIAVNLHADDAATARAMVYFLSQLIEHRPGGPLELTRKTQEVGWKALEISLPLITGVEEFAWSVLTSVLGRADPSSLAELLPKALLESTRNASRWGSRMLEEPVSVLQERDRAALVRAILSVVEDVDSGHFFHWPPFAHVLDLSKDRDVLLDWLENKGSRTRARVISLLRVGDAGFHEFAIAVLVMTERDRDVKEALLSHLGNVGFYTGSPLPELERRLSRVIEQLDRETEPQAREWLLEARASLESWINDRPGYLWDTEMTRREMEELVKAPDSPDRKWAIRRTLERAPREEALRLLTREDIEAAVEDPAIDEKTRLAWRTYLELRHPVR